MKEDNSHDFHIYLRLNGLLHRFLFIIPKSGMKLSTITRLELQKNYIKEDIFHEMLFCLRTDKNEKISKIDLERIMNDPENVAQYVKDRENNFLKSRIKGRLWVACPHCHFQNIEINLMTLSTRLERGLWPIFSNTLYYSLPFLSDHDSFRNSDKKLQPTPFVNIALPSHENILNSQQYTVLQNILYKNNNADYLFIVTEFLRQWQAKNISKTYWSLHNDGFRSVLNLYPLIKLWKGHKISDPSEIEASSVIDFYFLDSLCYLLFGKPDFQEEKVKIQCPQCRKYFLPVFN